MIRPQWGGEPVGKGVMWFVVTLVVAYLVVLALFRLFENRLIYFPNYPGRLSGDWRPKGLVVQDVWLRTADDVKLHAWWIAADGAEFTFLAFHGNAANIANRADIYRFLRDLPANVLAVEYRGYGRSEGAPSEAGLYRDAEAAYNYLVGERGIPPNRIIAFGLSLGTAVAADLASKHAVGGVVLVAPFPSAKAVARYVYPFLPGLGLVVRSKFDTAGKLARIHVPILVVHCTLDPTIPFALGEEAYRLAGEPKFFLRVEGECHEDATLSAPGECRARLAAFLNQLKSGTETR
jgi:fermentation-respiration switch protein FrsA (DUF1100 family)